MNDQPLPSQTPLEWLRYAEGDLRVAEVVLIQIRLPTRPFAFYAKVSAEKFIKAYLISQGWELQKTHDIIKLIKIGTQYTDKLRELEDRGDILNAYIAAGRYPQRVGSEEISKEDAAEAIESARVIRMCIIELMANPDMEN